MTAGRPPKPTAEHIADGTYRPHRHDGRLDARLEPGLPVPPQKLNEEESILWNLVCNHIPAEALSEVDGLALYMLVRYYLIWKAYDDEIKRQGTEADYKLVQQSVMCAKQFHSAASKFGLTPADRAKINLGETEEADAIEDLLSD